MALLLSDAERTEIRDNLFPESRKAIEDWDLYPWHRHRQRVTAGWPKSSQALSIDVFGFLKTRPQEERDAALGALARAVGVPDGGPWRVDLEFTMPGVLLGEPRPTQVDALAWSPHAVVAIECKFTEGGGACSRTGRARQCNGRYAPEAGNAYKGDHRCALTAKGIRYWEHVPLLFEGLRADRDHSPCPFASERYQWMRNLAAARALADGRAWAVAVAFADAPKLHAAEYDWPAFKRELAGGVRFEALSYQKLISDCAAAVEASGRDTRRWEALARHVERKIERQTGPGAPSRRS